MRLAETYRGARRNEVKAKRQLPVWRDTVAARANERANLAGRSVIANNAREAAAKANLVGNGKRHDTIGAAAMLAYYRTILRTRPIDRIIRELERQVRVASQAAAVAT